MTTTEILTGIKDWVFSKLSLKQDVINDLAAIRRGSQAGSTAVQPSDLSSYFNNASYDTNTHRINFYHGQNIVAYVDASPFIIDGMVNDVRIENGYLVIDFNTDSGKQDISIPLTDIFDPNNYYNKTQTDNLLAQKQDVIQDLSAIRSGAVFDLSAYNNNTTYVDLSAALTALNNISSIYKNGGMSFKFVRSSDNKYVQYRFLLSGTFTAAQFANTANWLKETSVEELNQLGQKEELISSKIIENYPVVAGGSNEKLTKGNFKAGVYGVLVRNIDTQNSGTYNIYITPGSSLFGYRQSCTIGIERTFSLQSDATMIGIGDINQSITSSGNMEIIIRRIDSNESIIERRNNIEENYSTRFFGDFINGTLGDGGVYSTYQAANRVCSISMLKYSRDIVLTAQNGVIFGIHYFDNQGNWLSDSGWISGTLKILKNTNFKVVINNGSNPLSIEYALDNVVVSTAIEEEEKYKLSVVGQGGTGILTDFQIGEKRLYKFSIPEEWSITNVGQGGNNVITIGYKIGNNRVDIFQMTKQRLVSEGFPKEFFVEFPSFDIDGFYIFLRADSGTVANVYYEYYNYDKLNVPTTYQGQRIDIDPKYAMSVLSRMNDYGTPSVNTYAQGMDVYNNRYIIQGCNKVGVGSHFIIIDMLERTLNTITYETLLSGQGFHMNNINLAGKYQDTDILPLVYCSECYNEKSCKVVRFSNTFDSFTIIQTIKYSGTTIQIQNYMDWILDYENGIIYAFKDSNNGLDLYGFNLPSLENSDVVLGDADIIKTIRIPNTSGKVAVTQGGKIINGRLWTAFGMDTVNYPGFMAVSDLNLQQMVSFVNLSGLGECESVCPYKQGVLLCCASGGLNAISLANPAYVYMIFNV